MNPHPFRGLKIYCRVVLGLGAGIAGGAEVKGQATGFPSMEDRSQQRETRLEPMLIFFPPNPPPLDRNIARGSPTSGRGAAPPTLAPYVNEIFYPALGSRFYYKTLSEKLGQRVEAYRQEKQALQAELRGELERGQDADRPTRRAALQALALKQAARLAELEKTAEQLRRDLSTSDSTWSALRQWRLGTNDRRGFSPLEIGQTMRGYAFYHDGLQPAQRRLLREIAIELAMATDRAETAVTTQPYLFFPPEPARVLLPDDLTPEVAAKVAAYQTKKTHLKKELYDEVFRYDGQRWGFLRANALKTLAEQQAGPFDELEQLAEEIRVGLTETKEPAAISEHSPLPPVLQARVMAMMLSFTTAQQEAANQVEEILADAKELPMQASFRFDGDGMRYVVIPTRASRGRAETVPAATTAALAAIEGVRQRIGAIADRYGRRVAEIINEKEAVRIAIGETLGRSQATAIDAALFAAIRVATARETMNLYRDYRIAVFQPGLSPRQRQLLFDAVMEQLNLPLPRGELQPIMRSSYW